VPVLARAHQRPTRSGRPRRRGAEGHIRGGRGGRRHGGGATSDDDEAGGWRGAGAHGRSGAAPPRPSWQLLETKCVYSKPSGLPPVVPGAREAVHRPGLQRHIPVPPRVSSFSSDDRHGPLIDTFVLVNRLCCAFAGWSSIEILIATS